MAAILKIMVLIMCLNIFLYLGVNYAMETDGATESKAVRINGDLFDILLADPNATDVLMTNYSRELRQGNAIASGSGMKFQPNLSLAPEFIAGADVQESAGGIPFIDALKTVRAFVVTLFNIAISPITLLTHNELPPLIAVMIALPLVLVELITLIIFIRGGGAS